MLKQRFQSRFITFVTRAVADNSSVVVTYLDEFGVASEGVAGWD